MPERPFALPRLEISVHAEAEQVRVGVLGEIDLCTSPLLGLTLDKVLADAPPRRLDLDLGGVTFLDASGVSVILRTQQHTEREGVRLRLLRPQGFVRRVLEITGVVRVCEVEE